MTPRCLPEPATGLVGRRRYPVRVPAAVIRLPRLQASPTSLDIVMSSEYIRDIRGDSNVSDGPHRSLNMRPGWKRLAERASNPAFNDRERADALVAALQDDWRVEIPRGFVRNLRNVLNDHQGELLSEPPIDRLEALRRETAGRPLAGMLLDCAVHEVHQGHRGNEALAKAADNALVERAAAGRRQVEEHWLRTPSARSATHVRNRIDGAIAASDVSTIASRCVGDSDGPPRFPLRKTGIDDGVSLT